MRSLCILLIFSLPLFPQPKPEPQEPKVETRHNESSQDKSSSESVGPANNKKPTRDAHPDQESKIDKKESTDERIAAYTEKLARYTLVLAVFTGVLIVVGILQFVALFRQARFLGHHSQLLKEVAGAAKLSADTGRDALRLTQCADVLIDTVGTSTGTQFRPDTVVTIRFINRGATRADELYFKIRMGIQGAFDESPFIEFPTALGSGEKAPLEFAPVRALITPESLADVIGGRLQFIFEGTVEYIDVFKVAHRTICGGRFDPRDGRFQVTKNHAEHG